MSQAIERYGIYPADLDPTRGREIAKTRPVVVVDPGEIGGPGGVCPGQLDSPRETWLDGSMPPLDQLLRTRRADILALAAKHGARGIKVDLVTEKGLRESIRERVRREAVPL